MDLGVFQRHLENLRVVFLLHFILLSWALVGYWSPTAYSFYNSLFLITILWGLHTKESEEPILMALYINCLSVLFDIPIILFFFPLIRFGSQIVSVFAGLLNLFLRFFTIISLCKMCESRGGTIPPFLSNIIGAAISGDERSYEDIDRTVPHQSVPQTELPESIPTTKCQESKFGTQVGVDPKSKPKTEKPKTKPRPDKNRPDNCPE